jgi:hypothetical protein
MYSQEEKDKIFDIVIESICNGNSLRKSCNNVIPCKTFFEWMSNDELKSKQYAYACTERADFIFEQTLNISDNVENDMITLEDGREVVNNAVIQRDRLRVDTRKWFLSKINPKKYGEKQIIDNTSSDGTMSPIDTIGLTSEEKTVLLNLARKQNE